MRPSWPSTYARRIILFGAIGNYYVDYASLVYSRWRNERTGDRSHSHPPEPAGHIKHPPLMHCLGRPGRPLLTDHQGGFRLGVPERWPRCFDSNANLSLSWPPPKSYEMIIQSRAIAPSQLTMEGIVTCPDDMILGYLCMSVIRQRKQGGCFAQPLSSWR